MKTKHRWIIPYHDTILINYHAMGLTDTKIAHRMIFCTETIREARRRLGLPPNVPKPIPVIKPDVDRTPRHKPDPIRVAKMTLGSRMQERTGGFWLDGVPVNLVTLMRETNRLRVGAGLDPVGPDIWDIRKNRN